MKFKLVSSTRIKFNQEFSHGLEGKFGEFVPRFRFVGIGNSNEETVFARMFRCYVDEKRETSKIIVSVYADKTHSPRREVLQLLDKTHFLQDLSVLLGAKKVSATVTLDEAEEYSYDEIFKCRRWRSTGNQISATGMPILNEREKTCEGYLETILQKPMSAYNFVPPPFYKLPWIENFFDTGVELTALVTVEVTVFLNPAPEATQEKKVHQVNLCEKMLQDEIQTDMVIVANNGAAVKCHKSFLFTCSPVFESMFESEMQESITGRIEMTDMSEEGVRAFLAFVYYLNTDAPNENCEIAFELLNAAHKYNVIGDMEGFMIKLLLDKPFEWFEAEVAVEIFKLARNIASGVQLKIKIADVLRQKCEIVGELTNYKEMFCKNPAAAMELCQLFAQHSLQ